MRFAPLLRRTGLPIALLALLPAVTAGEPIRFSGRSGPAQILEPERRAPFIPTEASSDRSGQRMDPLADGLLISTQPTTPTVAVSRKQLDADERRRNWLLQSPDSKLKSGSDRSSRPGEELFSDPDRSSTSSERPEETRDLNSKTDDRNRNERDSANSRDRTHNRVNPTEHRETGVNLKVGENSSGFAPRNDGLRGGLEAGGFFTAPEARNGAGRMFSEARERERQREREANLDAFKTSFGNPWAQTTTVGGTPALGLSGGNNLPATAGASVGELRRPALGAAGLDAGPRGKMDFGPSASAFDPKNPLNYGGAETVFKTPDEPRPQPKPIVLEIPKRKF